MSKFYQDLKDFLEDHKCNIQLRGYEVIEMKSTHNKGIIHKEPSLYGQDVRILINREDFIKLREDGLL